jgi:hypothetical protein
MAVHRPPTKLDKLASRQPNFRPDAPSPPPDSVPAFSPTARRLPLHRAEVTDVFYTPAVPRPNSPAIIVKSNTPDSSRLSRRGTRMVVKIYFQIIFSSCLTCQAQPARAGMCSGFRFQVSGFRFLLPPPYFDSFRALTLSSVALTNSPQMAKCHHD